MNLVHLDLGLLYAVAGVVVGIVVFLMFPVLVFAVTRRTRSELDDILTARLRLPLSWSCVAVGTWYGIGAHELAEPYPFLLRGSLSTITVLLWTVSVVGTSHALLDWLVAHRDDFDSVVTDRTLPVFDIAAKTVVWGGSIYFLFLAWDVDLTGWLASAGVIGVAVGFAAKDTLSNLIAGVFILADAPYKLGDYLVLENGDRGAVIEIGIRTTRLRTRDDVEIIVPNAVMANSRIVNQSGGPHAAFRLRIQVGVAYGSDLDQVREVLMDTVQSEALILSEPRPRVRFRAFGDSSLDHEVLGWVEEPGLRGRATDRVLTAIYKRFEVEGIEIPYPRRDLVLREPVRHLPWAAAADDGLTAED